MAILIPDSCPSRATVGEKRVYALLRDALPDHFTAWYEPSRVEGRYPDFTLLADDFGLLMLEVKGWYAGQIARATDHEVELHRSEGGLVQAETHKHPIRQVREYLFALVNQLARPEYAILRQHQGEHLGQARLPLWLRGAPDEHHPRPTRRGQTGTPLFPSDRVLVPG